jgi:ferritin-like metal-binding protein YciE
LALRTVLGGGRCAALLDSTPAEDKETDRLLSQLATRSINKEAAAQ